MSYTPQNWADILDDQVVTHGEVLARIADNELAPKSLAELQATPDKAITYFRFITGTWGVPLSKTGNDVLVKKDIVGWKTFLKLEQGTCTKTVYDGLEPADRANISYYNTTPTTATYVAGSQFVYGMMITNRDNQTGGSGYIALGLPTQGNIVITLTLPENTSFAGINYQWLTAGTDVTHTISGQLLTITITKSIDIFGSVLGGTIGYHIGVILNSTVPTSGTSPKSIYFSPTVTCAYTVNSPLTPTAFEARLLFAALSLTKTNSYASTIPYNQVFDYTITAISSGGNAVGVVITDTLPAGLTYQSIVSLPSGWTSSVSGSNLTFNSNGNSLSSGVSYPIVVRVKATSANTNISNTANATSTNAGTATATKANYIDYDRTEALVSQGYTTCASGVNTTVFRDTNTYSPTYNQYYVNGVAVGSTAPTNALCFWDSNPVTATLSNATTRTRNNCPEGSSPSTVTIQPTDVVGYAPAGYYRSYISQADADGYAATYANDQLQINLQNYANNNGTCTWCANNVYAEYTGYFTKNDCASGCYGSATIASSNGQTRSACSTQGYDFAYQAAYNQAYQAAVDYVNANGQNYANSVGSCCCWVADPTCDGCNRLGNRERNTCTGEYRNTGVTAYNSCDCGTSCAGTYWTPTCDGSTKIERQYYNCNGAWTGAQNTLENCSSFCTSTSMSLIFISGATHCYSGGCRQVYQDYNPCSSTYNQYFVDVSGSYINIGGSYTSCNNSCQDTGSPYCSGANWVINQSTACSGASCGTRVIEYNSVANGCYTPPPSCKTYEIYMYSGYSETVTVTYSACNGSGSTYNTFNDGGGGYGGSICATSGTAYISSGNAQLVDVGSCGT